jgi:hypothetical protein
VGTIHQSRGTFSQNVFFSEIFSSNMNMDYTETKFFELGPLPTISYIWVRSTSRESHGILRSGTSLRLAVGFDVKTMTNSDITSDHTTKSFGGIKEVISSLKNDFLS